MSELAGKKPVVSTRSRVDRLTTIKRTLREHYARKLSGTARAYPSFYDRDLKRLFTFNKGKIKREAASTFIRRVRSEIAKEVSPWIGDYSYQTGHVIKEMTGRCRELKLYVTGSERQLKTNLSILIVKYTMDSLYHSRRWVEM